MPEAGGAEWHADGELKGEAAYLALEGLERLACP